MLLTLVIFAGFAYFALFLVLQLRFVARPGRTSRQPEVRIVVTPYGEHLHIAAPSSSAAVDAFLRADLELAKEGK